MNIDKIIEDVLHQIPQPLWENWYIKEKIGSGSFSSVFRVEAVRTKRIDSAALKVEPILRTNVWRPMQNAVFLILNRKKPTLKKNRQ